MKRTLLILSTLTLIFSGLLLSNTLPSGAAGHPTYALGTAKKCRVDYVKRTERHNVTVKIKGKKVTESQRYVACVYVPPKPAPKPVVTTTAVPTAVTPTTVVTTTPTTSPAGNTGTPPVTPAPPVGPVAPPSGGGGSGGTTPQPPATPPVLAVTLDPSFTQSPNNPLSVTYAFSASATVNGTPDQSLPSGVLDFFSDGLQECSITVGVSITGGQCAVTYASLGHHHVVTEYISGSQTATTGSEDENILTFPTTVATSSESLGSIVDMSNWAYQQVTIPVTISGITTSLGTTGSISLTNTDASVLQCGQLSNHPSAGNATATCTADVENDPGVTTSWTPQISFTGDQNYSASATSGQPFTIPIAPAPTENDITVELQCAESGGFCSEYDSNLEVTDTDANVYAGPEFEDVSPQVGTVTFTSSDHLLICTAVVFSAADLPSNNARCVGAGGPFSGPLQVAYSGGRVEVGDTSVTIYSSATTSGGSN